MGSKLTVNLLERSQVSGNDAEQFLGVGAADITKLKANGFYTVAVRFPPSLGSKGNIS